ncbi:hypothetical protein C8R43DRAFT_929790 [Mycena crocata]|nr:hypothetical protein C8R43DRAFT_929790 [Mycena crocata]
MSDNDIVRIDGLWFSNEALIVLRAGKSAFRVTKSILAARSPVFQNMFEFPQTSSADGDETIDGSPVVVLHDSAEEVEPFLRAIFDSNYFMPPPAGVDFFAVLGILRLSHKYDVDYLFKRALLHLELVYPHKLDKMHVRRGEIRLHYQDHNVKYDLKAILVLHEVGATWFLPAAYYSIGTYNHKSMTSAGEIWDSLPAEIKIVCIAIPSHHIRASIAVNSFLASRSCCRTATRCNAERDEEATIFMHRFGTYDSYTVDPLDEWRHRGWDGLTKRLCSECFSAAKHEYTALETRVWNLFPGHCELESWPILMKKRQQALA